MLSKYDMTLSFETIPTLYINLLTRPDRKDNVEQELKQLQMTSVERFNAIQLEFGAIGCSISHLKCLEHARRMKWPQVFICEDDICFTNPSLFLTQINSFFKSKRPWDVVIVGGNNYPPYEMVDETCIRVHHCQTTTGYIVQDHYYNTLIDNYKKGIELFMQNPYQPHLYAIDQYWFHLQREHFWEIRLS